MESYAVLIGITVIILVSFVLKLCNHIHLKKEKGQYEDSLASFDFLRQEAPYEKYQTMLRHEFGEE